MMRTVESATRRLALRVAADRRAAFFAAACDGDLTAVRRALRKAPALWNATLEETGGTVMHALCDVAAPSEGQLGVARFMVRCNANLLQPDSNDSIALRSALIRSRGELARLLLPLSSMALDSRRFARRRLLNANALIDDYNTVPIEARHYGASTLHLLVVGGEPLRRLLSAAVLSISEAKAAARALDGDGRSPLSLAVAMRDARTVRLLLRARAPVHGSDHIGCEMHDDSTLSEEQAQFVFAPRPSDVTLATPPPSATTTTTTTMTTDGSGPSTPVAPDENLDTSDTTPGSAAHFAAQLGCGELAHAIERAAHFLKGKPSDPAPFPSSIVSPRESPVTPTRLNRAALTMSSRQPARQPSTELEDSASDRAIARSSRSTRTSAGGTPTTLGRAKQFASAATVLRRGAGGSPLSPSSEV
jgi:ankyrin repeat protein